MCDQRRRRCEYCQELFRADPRVGAGQRACGKGECQQARQRDSERRWREERPGYERERVARWRADNLEYQNEYRDRTPGLREKLRVAERARRAGAARPVDVRKVISPEGTSSKGLEAVLASVDVRQAISTELLVVLGLIDVLRGVDVRKPTDVALEPCYKAGVRIWRALRRVPCEGKSRSSRSFRLGSVRSPYPSAQPVFVDPLPPVMITPVAIDGSVASAGGGHGSWSQVSASSGGGRSSRSRRRAASR